jgi:hypothetical protein
MSKASARRSRRRLIEHCAAIWHAQTLDALRDALGPMTTKELAPHVMAERGLNTADVSLLRLFTRRTGALLRHQKKRGILRSVKDPQHGWFDLWEIAV